MYCVVYFMQVSLIYCTKLSMFHNLTPLTYCTKLPMFHNVTHVEFKILGNMWDWLPQMLERCHKLQSLIIQVLLMSQLFFLLFEI